MSSRSLGLAAAAGILLVILLYVFITPNLSTDALFWLNAITRPLLLAMVAFAAALAANRFGWWSEYPGRAWTLFFVEYLVLAVSEVLRRAAPERHLTSEIAVVIANLAGIGAYILMARQLRAAGLDFGTSQAKKVVVVLCALVVAVALCYSPVIAGWQSLRSADPSPGSIVSPLADIITFVLVAPLLLTTFALQGGEIFWTFAFLTAGTIGWMVNQGAATILRLFDAGEHTIRAGRMTGFAMACFLIAAAALTQWLGAQRALKGAGSHA